MVKLTKFIRLRPNKLKRVWQILYNTAIGFFDDGCNPRAAALTLYTLMSIVPVLAVALGLARGFGVAQGLEAVIREQLREQPEVAKYSIEFAYSLLESTTSGVIAGVGLLILLWSVYNILSNIEEALNNIWRIPNSRTLVRKITDYLSAIFICPFFFVMSSSITLYLKTHFAESWRSLIFLEYSLVHLFPYLLTWLLFTFLYFFLPNRHIPFKYGMIGAIVAGTAYQLLQTFYITIQLKLSSYGAIYGSFAALPLFLIWLNLSWMIVLAGAELAYQTEIAAWNDAPTHKELVQTPTQYRVLALLIVYRIVQTFCEGKNPLTLHQLSDESGASKKNLEGLIRQLIKYKIISETAYESDNEIYYQPARDVNLITLRAVIDIFPPQEHEEIFVFKTPLVPYFEDQLNKYDRLVDHVSANILLSTPVKI